MHICLITYSVDFVTFLVGSMQYRSKTTHADPEMQMPEDPWVKSATLNVLLLETQNRSFGSRAYLIENLADYLNK